MRRFLASISKFFKELVWNMSRMCGKKKSRQPIVIYCSSESSFGSLSSDSSELSFRDIYNDKDYVTF